VSRFFFQIYACGHSLCYGKREGEDLTDHGRAWERAARAIEKSVNQDFDLILDLQIKRSIEKEDNAWKAQIYSAQVKSMAVEPGRINTNKGFKTQTNEGTEFWNRKPREHNPFDNNYWKQRSKELGQIGSSCSSATEKRLLEELGGTGRVGSKSTERRLRALSGKDKPLSTRERIEAELKYKCFGI